MIINIILNLCMICVADTKCETDQVDIIHKQENYKVLNNLAINIRYVNMCRDYVQYIY